MIQDFDSSTLYLKSYLRRDSSSLMGKPKRGKNPGPSLKGIDAALGRKALERVQVVKDGSCLFRAVAHQVCGHLRRRRDGPGILPVPFSVLLHVCASHMHKLKE